MKLRDRCRKLCKFQQECQQLPVALLPCTHGDGSRILNELRHQEKCYDNNRQPGEVFLTGGLSRWQWFGPWPEAVYSDRVTICSCHERSLAQLPAHLSVKSENWVSLPSCLVCVISQSASLYLGDHSLCALLFTPQLFIHLLQNLLLPVTSSF